MGLFDAIGNAVSGFVADQKARISNVISTEKAVITNIASTVTKVATLGTVNIPKTHISANTSNETVNKALETVANHPLTSAFVGTLAAAPVATLETVGMVASKVASTAAQDFSKMSLAGKATTLVAAPIAVGLVAKSKTIQKNIVEGKPVTSLTDLGGDLGMFIDQPSWQGAIDLIKKHPVATGVGVAGALSVIGGGIGLAANTLSTFTNSSATKENTKEMQLEAAAPTPPQAVIYSTGASTEPTPSIFSAPATTSVTSPESTAGPTQAPIKKAIKKKKKKATTKKKKSTKKKATKKKTKKKVKKKAKSLKTKKKKAKK